MYLLFEISSPFRDTCQFAKTKFEDQQTGGTQLVKTSYCLEIYFKEKTLTMGHLQLGQALGAILGRREKGERSRRNTLEG